MVNKIGNSWVVDVSHYNNGRDSSLRLYKTNSRSRAIKEATNYMRLIK
jgi:hypothetical protein